MTEKGVKRTVFLVDIVIESGVYCIARDEFYTGTLKGETLNDRVSRWLNVFYPMWKAVYYEYWADDHWEIGHIVRNPLHGLRAVRLNGCAHRNTMEEK